ncbi:MAG: acyltransferase family protein [Prosthecobacter sp.]|uniref:acyltransferase family protein n=1 Tax=Prosthecobacter sp. TaxID=1965333 RepID=UPI0039028C56
MPAAIENTHSTNVRITGLDAVRFVAALFVVFSHCGYPPLTQGLDRSNAVALTIQGIYGNIFPGVAAVIVFFVISGFCIHYPHRHLQRLDARPYFARRYVRIFLPMIAAVLLAWPLNVNLALFQNSVLWSLLAELIYYTLYPLLHWLRGRLGWLRIIALSYAVSYLTVLSHPDALDYTPFGPSMAWLVALPCWLLGCMLAEADFHTVKADHRLLWCYRGAVWMLGWTCSVLRFHSPLGYPWTLSLFAVAVFFWLRMEIASSLLHSRHLGRFGNLLEKAGAWSYSLYLIHMVANTAFDALPLPDFGFNLNWTIRVSFILASAWLLYLLVEHPSHRLARHLAKKLSSGRKSDDNSACTKISETNQ